MSSTLKATGSKEPPDPFQRRVMFLASRNTDGDQELEVRMRPADILRWARVFSSDAVIERLQFQLSVTSLSP